MPQSTSDFDRPERDSNAPIEETVLLLSASLPLSPRELPFNKAKASYKTPGDGLQQAKEYATILGLKLAYTTNGNGILESTSSRGPSARSPSS